MKTNPKQKAVFENLRSFYYAAGESISLNMTVYIRDELIGSLEPFYNVDVELMIAQGDSCGIRIYCEDGKYERLGMKKCYTVKTAKFTFEEMRDFQSSYNALKIQPYKMDGKFILLNVKEINRLHV